MASGRQRYVTEMHIHRHRIDKHVPGWIVRGDQHHRHMSMVGEDMREEIGNLNSLISHFINLIHNMLFH